MRRIFRFLIVLTLSVLAAALLTSIFVHWKDDLVYRKDILQEYVLAKAPTLGLDPYQNVNDLAPKILGPLPLRVFPHPTPHPPFAAILGYPLTFFTYPTAALIWFCFELCCMYLCLWLLTQRIGISHRPVELAFYTLGATLWEPFRNELFLGQLTTLILLLILLFWKSLDRHKDMTAGALLGTATALKLFTWPLVVFLLLHRKWRAAGSAIVTIVLANLLGAWYLGFNSVVYYYRHVPSIVVPIYRANIGNVSLYALPWRLFQGSQFDHYSRLKTMPLLYAPQLPPILGPLFVLLVLGAGLYLAYRSDFAAGFAICICVSVLISPISWEYYFLLALIPAAVLWHRLPRPQLFAILILISSPVFLPVGTIVLLLNSPTISHGEQVYSFWPNIWTVVPAIGAISAMLELFRSSPSRYASETKRDLF
jgi:hypothetical protein